MTRWSLISALCIALIPSHEVWAQSLEERVDTVRQINSQQPVTDTTENTMAIADDAAPSDRYFTEPSLWWQQQQQSDAINQRLIDSWQAYIYEGGDNAGKGSSYGDVPHVDVVVNGQIWPLLSYLEQYAFMTQFGDSAKAYGYQLRVFTGQRLVGLHVCEFKGVASQAIDGSSITAEPSPLPNCMVELDYFGQGAIRGRRQR